MAIPVKVKLLFDLKRYAPCGNMPFTMLLRDNATLGNLLKDLAIPQGPELVALVDGAPSGWGARLHPNSKVTIFPVVLGG
jgi:sulfur carrier protein ThiS